MVVGGIAMVVGGIVVGGTVVGGTALVVGGTCTTGGGVGCAGGSGSQAISAVNVTSVAKSAIVVRAVLLPWIFRTADFLDPSSAMKFCPFRRVDTCISRNDKS